MPPDSSIRKWGRTQVARYLDKFPDHKPKSIMLWLASHRQNPWPDVKSYTLCRMMNEIKNSWKYPADFAGHIGIAEKVSTVTIETVSFLWDMKRPYNVEVEAWRKVQMRRFVKRFPHHKQKTVLEWIKSQTPNPWPSCTPKDISYVTISIIKSWEAVKTHQHYWNYSKPVGITVLE